MTLKELKDTLKDFPDDIADKLILAICIRDEKDIIEENGYITFPEFKETFNVDCINIISEGTMPPKLFFIGNRKRKES